MRFALTTVLLALAGSGVSGSDGPTVAGDAARTVSLRVGEATPVGHDDLRVGFDAVLADSRCPKDVQCFWAGDATVVVWLQRGSGPKQSGELHAARAQAAAVRALGYTVRLLALDPVPIASKAGTKPEYVATLLVVPGAATDPDR